MTLLKRSRTTIRRLLILSSALAVATLLVIGSEAGLAATRFINGIETVITIETGGAGCGSEIHWDAERVTIQPGTRVRFVNATDHWEIPLVVQQVDHNGQIQNLSESPELESGATWTHVFWREGEYRVASSYWLLEDAGLVTTIHVGT